MQSNRVIEVSPLPATNSGSAGVSGAVESMELKSVVSSGSAPPAQVSAPHPNGDANGNGKPNGKSKTAADAERAIAAANELVKSSNLETGLSMREVDARRHQYGWNETVKEPESIWLLTGKKSWGLSPWILEIVIVVSAALGKWYVSRMIIAHFHGA